VSIGLASLLLAILEYRQSIRALGAPYASRRRSCFGPELWLLM